MTANGSTQRTNEDDGASRALAAYIRRRFWLPVFAYDRTTQCALRMTGDEWTAIRNILQRLTGLDDLSVAMQLARGRDVHALTYDPDGDDDDDEAEIDEDGYRIVDPQPDPGLPHGWLTLLEAAYEQLDDADGLERLYAYYILADMTSDAFIAGDEDDEDDETGNAECDRDGRNPDDKTTHAGHIIGKLRRLATRPGRFDDDSQAETHWHELLDTIVHAFESADDPGFPLHSIAYEELLAQERLSDAAWRYCRRESDTPWFGARERASLDRLFDVIAIDHAAEACELTLRPLHDADSALMREDTQENRRKILLTLNRCATYAGPDRARNEAERLLRLYRKRKELREGLTAFMEGLAAHGE